MVETITPVVHGGNRRRWGVSVALHTLGTTLGAATLGLALGGAGRLAGAPWGTAGLLAVALTAALYAARDLFGLKVPIPDRKRQVPDWWRTFFPPHATAFLYGVGLGVGFLTYLSHGTLVVVALAATAAGDPLLGLVVMAPFGLARGLAVAATGPAPSREAASATVDRLERIGRSRLPAIANAIAAALVAGTAAVALAVGAGGGDLSLPDRLPALILAGSFAWAAVAKAVRPADWRAALDEHRLPARLAGPASVGVPTAELVIAVLLVASAPRLGAAGALVLLAAFSAALIRARAIGGARVPCGCFGRRRVDLRTALLRNAALALVAFAVALSPPARGLLAGGLRPPRAGEWLPAALVLAGVAVSWWAVRQTVVALRGIGRP